MLREPQGCVSDIAACSSLNVGMRRHAEHIFIGTAKQESNPEG